MLKYFLFLYFIFLSAGSYLFAQRRSSTIENEAKELRRQVEGFKIYKRFPEIYGVYFTVKLEESPSILPPDYFSKDTDDEIYYDKMDNGKWGYFAGMFNYYESASAFRRDMLERGYRDAVIVAYNNGKRIPIDEAIRLVEKSFTEKPAETSRPDKSNSSVKIIEKPVKKPGTTVAGKPQTTSSAPPKTATSTVVEQKQAARPVPAAKSTPAPEKNVVTANTGKQEGKEADNIEFRIQVAASKNSIASTHPVFKGFQNVYTEKSEDGFYRYYVGSYVTLESAINARKKIMDGGAKEALVVAFHKKKRISLAEAQRLMGNSE